MYSLGFSIGHDRGAVVVHNGRVLVGINDERLSRIKHQGAYSEDLPEMSIKYCLDYLGLSFSDIDQYVYTYTEFIPGIKEKFETFTGLTDYKLAFMPHHLAHAFSTFYSSGFDSAAVIVADGMGSVLTGDEMPRWYSDIKTPFPMVAEGYSIYEFNLRTYREVYKKWLNYPAEESKPTEEISVGVSYGIGALQLVFNQQSNTWPAGKLMGLASYSTESNSEEVSKKLKLSGKDLTIFGGVIQPNVNHASDFYSKANLAGTYQKIQEVASLHLVGMAKEMVNSPNLCVAGGSFLNCNTNELILKSGHFEQSYFIPAADDSGIALGCAWYGLCLNKTLEVPPARLSPYIGKKYSSYEILEALNHYPELKYNHYTDYTSLIDHVSSVLSKNKVIGWMQGGSEVGPRALGNRSIIASPKEAWMKEYINSDIKRREWYRPFAPSVIFESQSDVFDLDIFSPYMLVTTLVKDDWKHKIPAVTHIDGTARIQSVTKISNPRYYELIQAFRKKTGIPVLLNTSFNGPSESIVETPLDAIRTFLDTNLYGLVINNFYIYR